MLARLAPHHRAGFLAGLGAGVLLTATMLLLSRGLGLFSLAELVAYQIVALLPLWLFSLGVETLRGTAKQLLLVCVFLGQLAISGALGALWASLAAPLPGETRPRRRAAALWPPTARGGLAFALLLFLAVEGVLLPLAGGGFFGTATREGATVVAVTSALEALVYSLALAAFYQRFYRLADAEPGPTAEPRLSRRRLLQRALLGLAALAVGGAALGLVRRTGGAPGVTARPSGRVGNGDLPPEVTPTPDFYEVSKNFADPKVSPVGWKLDVGGLVERPYSLTLDELKALPVVRDYRTLCCISNEVGGDLISNAAWAGVRVKDLLERAGVKPGAVDLKLTASDGYTESFPIAKALTPDVLAVYEMNGAPLPDSHGFPVRLLVPNIYGMKNVKWVTRLDVIGEDYQGYWQERGWSDVATIKTMSRFDFPRARQVLPAGRSRVGGVAFAGARGIAKVEATSDGGRTWQEARLRRPLGLATWVLWTAELDLGEGERTLMVRATDGAGVLQTAAVTPPAPDGASGWHTIAVRAVTGLRPTAGGQTAAAPTTPAAPVRNQGIYTP